MEIVVTLVAVAGLSAAGVWWWMSRSDAPLGSSTGFGPASTFEPDEHADFFVLPPSDSPPVRIDRPPRGLSLARLALAVAVSTLILVALAYVIGFVVKVQLDRYFTTGG